MTLNRGVLELEADVDGDGTQETGVFEIVGGATVTEQVQKDYQFTNEASGIVSIVSQLPGLENAKRKGFFLDLGAGAHIFEIQFMGWAGAIDGDGNPVQWGDGSGTFPADATQDYPIRQMQCFMRYLQFSTTDSFAPAELHWGDYSDGTYGASGELDPLNVAIQGPRNTHAAEDYSTFDGTFTAIEVLQLTKDIDILERSKRGA